MATHSCVGAKNPRNMRGAIRVCEYHDASEGTEMVSKNIVLKTLRDSEDRVNSKLQEIRSEIGPLFKEALRVLNQSENSSKAENSPKKEERETVTGEYKKVLQEKDKAVINSELLAEELQIAQTQLNIERNRNRELRRELRKIKNALPTTESSMDKNRTLQEVSVKRKKEMVKRKYQCTKGLFRGVRTYYDGAVSGFRRYYVPGNTLGNLYGVTLWFRSTPRGVWPKGEERRYILTGGPLVTLKHTETSTTLIAGIFIPWETRIGNKSAPFELHLTSAYKGEINTLQDIKTLVYLNDMSWHHLHLSIDSKLGDISLAIDGQMALHTTLKNTDKSPVFDNTNPFDIFIAGTPERSYAPWYEAQCNVKASFHGQVYRPVFHNETYTVDLSKCLPPRDFEWNPGDNSRILSLQSSPDKAYGSPSNKSSSPYNDFEAHSDLHVLYSIGHLRTFPYSNHFSPYFCPKILSGNRTRTRRFLVVLVTPEHIIQPPSTYKTLKIMLRASESALQEWWDNVGKPLFLKSNSSLRTILIPESARANAFFSLLKPIQDKWTWARDSSHWGKKNSRKDSLFFTRTMITLTSFRYQYLREAHTQGLKAYKEEHGKPMPSDQLIILTRPDIQYKKEIPGLFNIQDRLRDNPKLVFGFWDAYDLLDDRVVLLSRAVMDLIVGIDHVCKWESTWFNQSSKLRMHVSNTSQKMEWDQNGPSVLWDFLLDLEICAESVYAMDPFDFGDYFQYKDSVCMVEAAHECAEDRTINRGYIDVEDLETCRDICRPFGGDTPAFNISYVNERKLDFSLDLKARRQGSGLGEFPRVERTNTKGYFLRRVRNKEPILRELEDVRARCVIRSSSTSSEPEVI